MDANQARYWHLCDGDDLRTRSPRLTWCARRAGVVLAQAQEARLPARDASASTVQSTWLPQVVDRFGQLGSLNGAALTLEGESFAARTLITVDVGRGPEPLRAGALNTVIVAPEGVFTHLGIGGDGRLAALFSNGTKHGLLVIHLAHRWIEQVTLPLAGAGVTIDAANQVWIATTGGLLRATGGPLPQDYVPGVARFEPEPVNPHPLRLDDQVAFPVNPSISGIAGLCCHGTDVVVAVNHGDGSQSLLVIAANRTGAREVAVYPLTTTAPGPVITDVASLGDDRLALLAPVAREGTGWSLQHDCAIVRLRAADATANPAITAGVDLVQERHPLREPSTPWFVPGMDGVVRYQTVRGPRGLYPLAIPRYPDSVVGQITQTIDSGILDCTWHRAYLDAHIPPGCRIRLYVRTSDARDDWTGKPFERLPDVTWNPLPSELPFSTNPAGQERAVRGLFETLVQRENGRVRALRGRYLQVRIGLFGDGRQTPVLHALRIYYPRFSYQEQYLPPHLRQQERVQPGIPGDANGADVRERFFAALEGMLTPIEGTVAAAERWFDPWSVPAAALPWLGSCLGLSLDPAWPEARARRYVAQAGRLHQLHGTVAGVALALDLATDGAVGRGEIVVVENFRLRRSMATLLGINMEDTKNPLTLGTMVSGNSIVGDSLILSAESSRAFLALFDPALATSNERAAVARFFDEYAHQVSILLHGPARAQRETVERTLRSAMPAHIQWQVLATDHPFVLGLSPLLKIDTFLERTPPPRPVVVGDTWISREGFVTNPPALSPADVAD